VLSRFAVRSNCSADNIAPSNFLDRASPLLNPASAFRHDQDLTERVGMPSAPRAGLEPGFREMS